MISWEIPEYKHAHKHTHSIWSVQLPTILVPLLSHWYILHTVTRLNIFWMPIFLSIHKPKGLRIELFKRTSGRTPYNYVDQLMTLNASWLWLWQNSGKESSAMSEVDKNMLLLMDVRTMNCSYDRRFILTPLQPNTGKIFFDLRKMSHLTSIKVFFGTMLFRKNQKDLSNTFFSFLCIISPVLTREFIMIQILLSGGPHQVQPLRFKSFRTATFAPGEIATKVSKCCRNILVVSLWSFKVQRQVNNVNRPAMIATTYSRGHKTLQYAGHLFAIRWCFTQKCIHNLPLIAQIREHVGTVLLH